MHACYLIAGAGFEAARRLPADHGKAARPHGHSFRLSARSEVQYADQAALQAAVQAAVAPLDYADLNAALAACDDLSLARHVADALPHPAAIQLRGAPDRGVMLDGPRALSWIASSFEAAHHLPHVPPGHKCGRLHGHGFGVRIVADAAQCGQRELARAWAPLHRRLNHHYLNDIAGLDNPTSEVLAQWLHQQLSDAVLGLAWVEVRETHSAGSQFDGKTFRIWKEQRFESAIPFDADGNYTGHSYLVRLMLSGGIDRTMGWLLDFGDVKDRFKPIYRQLDHNPLDKLASVRGADSAAVAEWIHAQLSPLVPELSRIDLMESDDAGVSLHFRQDMRWPLL
ncbi:6-carboxytetrahydropterin synthase [Chromobacterium violaceum]|uniref:6-pyruvoyl trahydropterin synthase family protein n=1 Tax=Chromobacterium violaceum TaxID=536 RepID=UPI001B340104|nr:6-carboxytetrahydropterin synthase [Chromobacterium violaceum]MBT2867134.1 6-carboxytetrahydropterin synthase [Chromobacterium violaceum]